MKIKVWFGIVENGKVISEPLNIDKYFTSKFEVDDSITVTEKDTSNLSDINKQIWNDSFGPGEYTVKKTMDWDYDKNAGYEQAVSVTKV
tara:strand:+ start:6226 stop:6492 length:267 start_codon:yes stop_codon:yes gene_type:complete